VGTKAEKRQQKIDTVMESVPSMPKGFIHWIRDSAFKDSKYIFYKRKGTKVHGVCSSCKNSVEMRVGKAKHKQSGRCPVCRAKITYRAINKAKYYKDTVVVSIVQRMENEPNHYVVRWFHSSLEFKNGEDTQAFPDTILDKLINPEIRYWEGSREIIKVQKNGKTVIKAYEDMYDWNVERYRWKKERARSSFYNRILLRDYTPIIYKRNLKGVLKNTKWKYSGLDYFNGRAVSITDYLHTYEQYPAIEMLSKLNLSKLLNEIIKKTNWYGGVGGILKMDKKLLGLNLGTTGIEFISTLDEIGKYVTDKQIRWVMKNCNPEVFTQLLRFVTPQKAINYMEKQMINIGSNEEEKRQVATTWRDYLGQCEKLELDITNDFVSFPRNLHEKHIEYSMLVQLKADESIDRGIRTQYDKWNNLLSYRSENMEIKVAESHRLVLEEGQALRHCVGGIRYCKNMADGKRLILFIRNNEQPYYTVEFDIENLKIMQNRGYKNEAPSEDVKKFVNKWKVKKLLNVIEMKREAM